MPRRPALGTAIALALTLALPAVALAAGDDVAADGDGIVPVTELGQMQLGTMCLGEEITRTALVAAKRVPFTGLTSWLPSAVVTFTVATTNGDGLSASVPSAPGNQITLPSNWSSIGEGSVSPEYVESTITITPTQLGSYNGFVIYEASGQRVSGGVGNHTETGGFNIFGNVVECPTVSITTPADGETYLIDSVVAADYSCASDSAIVTCAGPVADGASIDTATVGTKTFTVNAENEAGGTATASVTYRVIYRFDYIGPILEHPATNVANAGQRIKVRFTMYGEFGKNVIKGWPRHRRVDCNTGAPLSRLTTGRIENFRYVPSVDQYMLGWNTNAAWDGTCRDFVVRLRDGTQRTAHFNFATP